MRKLLRFLFCLVMCLGVVALHAAEPGFPYKAYITADNVQVRSGPGDNYYATDKLKTGAEVEVYRNDPGGWLAIRPPKGSFSWVRTHSLQLHRDGVAMAAEDRVAVRVGSQLSDARDVIQVRLKQGELVELFDAPRPGDRRGDPRAGELHANDPWSKIAPPAGEFRWVPARFVDASFPKDGVGRSPVVLSGRASTQDATQPANASQKSLSAIDLELSAMVAGPSVEWEFTDLRNRAQVLFDQAGSPLERGRARAVLSRIARFEDIHRREAALAAAQARLLAGSAGSSAGTIAPSTIGPSQDEGRYDAQGQLVRVPPPAPGGPQYAVLDSSGHISSYISPAPGVNLISYLGHEVGITGSRGYLTEQRATHIMARHVDVVDGAVTR